MIQALLYHIIRSTYNSIRNQDGKRSFKRRKIIHSLTIFGPTFIDFFGKGCVFTYGQDGFLSHSISIRTNQDLTVHML